MGRYLSFNGNYFNFPIRADFRKRKEYFSDYVLSGGRDKAIYGVIRITPELTAEYDVNGLRFLEYVLGTVSDDGATISVESTLPTADYKVTVDSDNMSIHNAKVNTWELRIEEGNPVRAEFSVIGNTIGTEAATQYNVCFSSLPLLPNQCTLFIDGVANTIWNRISVRINNNLEPLFKGSTIPQEIRERGLEVTGAIRANEYSEFLSEGSIDLVLGTIGTLVMANVKLTEVPARVRGFDLPETEISFQAFPVCTDNDAIIAYLGDTITW